MAADRVVHTPGHVLCAASYCWTEKSACMLVSTSGSVSRALSTGWPVAITGRPLPAAQPWLYVSSWSGTFGIELYVMDRKLSVGENFFHSPVSDSLRLATERPSVMSVPPALTQSRT